MGSTQFGNFFDFCRDSTLPICNVLSTNRDQTGPWSLDEGACELRGITLSGDRNLRNLGTILICFLAILGSAFLIWRSERKRAAVGRREIQLFLLGFIIIQICEIFTVGGFPLNGTARVVFSAIHIGMIIATTWILLLNAVVGFQVLDDGTALSIGLITISSALLFVGTGYIVLDTGLQWTEYWNSSYEPPNRHIALYVLYQLIPLIFLVVFFLLEAVLVIKILKEKRPMLWLTAAALLFALGQIFNYVISSHICDGTNGRIDGALFQTLFTALSVGALWYFWSSITEDDWPAQGGYP